MDNKTKFFGKRLFKVSDVVYPIKQYKKYHSNLILVEKKSESEAREFLNDVIIASSKSTTWLIPPTERGVLLNNLSRVFDLSLLNESFNKALLDRDEESIIKFSEFHKIKEEYL